MGGGGGGGDKILLFRVAPVLEEVCPPWKQMMSSYESSLFV